MLKYYAFELALVSLVALFLIGSGYLITQDMASQERQYNICINAGNQYIHGTCVK